jgi:hypothetical protein
MISRQKQSFLDPGIFIKWQLPIRKIDGPINEIFKPLYRLEMASGLHDKQDYPLIWLGYNQDILAIGVESGSWHQLNLLVQVRPADPYLKSLEGYAYKLSCQRDEKGSFDLAFKPLAAKKFYKETSIHKTYEEENRCAWAVSKSTLKGWSPLLSSKMELALSWSSSHLKQSLAWPVPSVTQIESNRHFWAELIFQ